MKARPASKSRFVGDFEIKAKDDGARTFEGTLSTSHIDLGDFFGRRDIVHPGAFKRTLDHFRSAKDAYIPLIDSHEYDSIFNVYGHLLDGEEILTGQTLRYEKTDGTFLEVAEMRLNTKWQVIDGADGDRLLDRLRPGSVRKMSMGYKAVREDFEELKHFGRTRNLREVKLGEGSLVVFPMNPEATVDTSTVKSFDEISALLRDGTLTDEQKDQLRALLAPPAPPAPALAPPEQLERIKRSILALTLRRLATGSGRSARA